MIASIFRHADARALIRDVTKRLARDFRAASSALLENENTSMREFTLGLDSPVANEFRVTYPCENFLSVVAAAAAAAFYPVSSLTWKRQLAGIRVAPKGEGGRRLAAVLGKREVGWEGGGRGAPRVCSGIGVRWRKIVTH